MVQKSRLTVMTFNLRTAYNPQKGATPDGPDSWDNTLGTGNRRALAVELIKQYQPDIIGTQEDMKIQLDYLTDNLEEYAWFGQCRDGEGVDGEYNAIFYKRSKFELKRGTYFWLSDTPNIPSITWGNRHKRMVTCAKLALQDYPKSIYVFNTHFPLNLFPEAQKKSTEQCIEALNDTDPDSPLFFTGDFNATSESYVLTRLREAGFIVSWDVAEKKFGPAFTAHQFQGLRSTESSRIDWIVSRLPASGRVRQLETITFNVNERYASDHFPVQVEFEL